MAAHTPGPWRVDGKFISPHGYLSNPVASTWQYLGQNDEEVRANAHLIAAAPDLLKEAREFCRRVDAGEIRSKKTYEAFAAIIERLEGRS